MVLKYPNMIFFVDSSFCPFMFNLIEVFTCNPFHSPRSWKCYEVLHVQFWFAFLLFSLSALFDKIASTLGYDDKSFKFCFLIWIEVDKHFN